MALLPAHLLQHLESQVLVSQLLLGEVKVLGFLRREKSMASGLQQSSQSKALPMLHLTRSSIPPPPTVSNSRHWDEVMGRFPVPNIPWVGWSF